MNKAYEYRQHAATCLLIAETTSDPHTLAAMMSMAAVWTRLAEQAEKNQTLDLVYETPPPPPPQPAIPQAQQMQQQRASEEPDE